ncbi:protein HUA2-LIKE 3-like [Typha angustifolia]|uniref:protein HUA2-LIKE 3-like n=1 Tax=Typha angustifolia TaxID=59011 RepID=UPI003C305044
MCFCHIRHPPPNQALSRLSLYPFPPNRKNNLLSCRRRRFDACKPHHRVHRRRNHEELFSLSWPREDEGGADGLLESHDLALADEIGGLRLIFPALAMAPARKKGSARAAAAAAAAAQQWKVGDLVLAKLKGFPAWPAMISEPERWGLKSVRKKMLVYFYGTEQIAFCNYADIEAFTEEKKKSLLVKRQGKGSDFVRAVDEIIDIYESLKKQKHNEFNLANDCSGPKTGNLESLDSSSGRESPKVGSFMANNHKSETLCASIGSCDMVSSEETSMTLMEGEHCNGNSAPNEPAEKVSTLDELGHNHLTTTITTTRKKRLVDTLQQNITTQNRSPLLWRSRSLSNGEPKKVEASTMALNDSDVASGDLIANKVQEESTQNNDVRDDYCASNIDDTLPHSSGLLSNEIQIYRLSELCKTYHEANNISSGSMPESSCKSKVSVDGSMETELILNDKFDLPTKTLYFKKKRKPNRKRLASSAEFDRLNKEPDLKVELCEIRPKSPICQNAVNYCIHKSDGDEHLPPVKRARLRMDKSLSEETQVVDFVSGNNKLEMTIIDDNCDKPDTVTTSGNHCSTNAMSCWVKEDYNTSPMNNCSVPSGRDLILKTNTFQPKVLTVDVEAALPPSKRLHRALEAMSANAEAIDDHHEASRSVDLIPNGCVSSPMTSSLHHSADVNAVSPMTSDSIEFSDSPAGKSASALTVQNVHSPTLVSSEVKQDDTLNCSQEKDWKEIPLDCKNYGGADMSTMSVIDAQDTNLPPSSLKVVGNHVNPTFSEVVPDQLSSSLDKVNENEVQRPKQKYLYFHIERGDDGSVEPVRQKRDSILNSLDGCDSVLEASIQAVSVRNVGSSTSKSSVATKSSDIQLDAHTRTSNLHSSPDTMLQEVKHKATLKDWCISPDSAPMKDLIAAAQARRLLSRSTSFSDNFIDPKVMPEAAVIPSPFNKEGCSGQASPSNSRTCSTVDRIRSLQICSRSPYDGLRQKGLTKLAGHAEANAARKAFEALLCTLSRTKESIGRATRLAIECAKYGIAGEVVDILLENVERETNFYKRVDIFFLVDSITQCSRSQKGGAADVYPSLVQSVLPRLLSAVAPPGNAAWENRRQCLKVLRLWLERKTLPEFIIRHHIRELESINESSFSTGSSRRPTRTERAINDPLREMEGMLVDEYGSNTGFQLPCLLHTSVLEDEEGSPSEEKGFEAVTPERYIHINNEKGTTQNSSEKHRHILEDIDGELEMEDVAPPFETEVRSVSQLATSDKCAENQSDQHQAPDFTPPLPNETPPSPPPLPSSPPPLVSTCPADISIVSQPVADSQAHADPVKLHCSSITQTFQNQQSQSGRSLNSDLTLSESLQFHNPGYGGNPVQMPPPGASLNAPVSYGSFSVPNPAIHPANNFQPAPQLQNNAYHLQPPPPPPMVSNQFSYVQAEPQQRPQPWGSCPSFSERYHQYNVHDRGNIYGDRGFRQPMEFEGGRFNPAIHPAPSFNKIEASPNPFPHYGPPSDPSPVTCPVWSLPPRMSSYSLPASRPAIEGPISQVSGAPGYWRPR